MDLSIKTIEELQVLFNTCPESVIDELVRRLRQKDEIIYQLKNQITAKLLLLERRALLSQTCAATVLGLNVKW